MKSKTLKLEALLIACLVCTSMTLASDEAFVKGQAKLETSLPYLLALPKSYATDKADSANGGHGWPLVLFLHGSGERGTDLVKVARSGPMGLIQNGRQFPFAVVAPQCPDDEWWDAQPLRLLVLQLQKQYGFDPDRTYVTGMSMGGFATFDLITRYPELFAAAVPVCGGGDPFLVSDIGKLKTMPVWAFHGADDPIVPVARSVEMMDKLKAIGDSNVRLTIYPGIGHPAWRKAYVEDDLYTWLLAQHRSQPTTQPK